MGKRFFGLLCLSVLLLLIGCQMAPIDSSGKEPGETRVVTDILGREVAVPVKVERIGCLYAISGHAVTMLGKGDKIVAVVEGLRRDVILKEINPVIQNAAVPKNGEAINIEELARVLPDVVFIQISTAINEAELEKLKKFNIPALVVDYKNMAQQQDAVKMMGQAIGAEKAADDYVAYYQAVIEKVSQRTKTIPPEKRVRVYHAVNEATRTDARDTLPADWLAAVGVNNVSLDQNLQMREDKYFASMEQILLWDADVILVNEDGVDDYIRTNEHWANLKAVKGNKVFKMPNGISRWGHHGSLETPLAMLWTAKTLYPHLFLNVDMIKETLYFYEKFFHYTINNETARRILQGKGMREAKN